jgi:hypothetical protein
MSIIRLPTSRRCAHRQRGEHVRHEFLRRPGSGAGRTGDAPDPNATSIAMSATAHVLHATKTDVAERRRASRMAAMT